MSDRPCLDLHPVALAELCRRHHVRELALFGSALGPDFGDESDVDLLVEFHSGFEVGLLTLLALQAELALLLGRRVDLVPKAGLKSMIRDEILAQARVLYAA
ncbi:MAG: nucleotidyltransferase domain-containing protein [Planctomycetes bacterium]|nr:nucleotidyltransferase domain-containing protein [Planctomycetota bacterium]